MRPRLLLNEAKFLVESLDAKRLDIEKKLERMVQLEGEVKRLLLESQVNPYILVKEGYLLKKQELLELSAESSKLHSELEVCEGLKDKLQVLGCKQKGRHKGKAGQVSFWLNSCAWAK